jgi:hypothetical protein
VGKNCEVDIDECLSSPCENNGNCTDGDNRYICACKDGFMGDNCETSTNDDECDVSPCQNNGKCRHQEESGLYACDCCLVYWHPQLYFQKFLNVIQIRVITVAPV